MAASSSALVPSLKRDVLLDAISDFQANLSDGERLELKKMRSIPDADSILVFTAELDATHRTRRGPSYASRLHTVLSSIGVFCGIVDTFVSAHPEIAALVWGSIKLTMTVAANVASYYQATSDLFMRLGRLCPLFADYQSLYPGSVRLQKALVDFHASIIRCCRHVMQVLQRPLHQHILKSLWSSFEQEFKPDIDEVQRYSDSVEQEIHFAKAQADQQDQQLQVMERQEALKSRSLIDRFTGRADEKLRRMHEMQLQRDQRESTERKRQLLDSLSTRDYLRLYKESCRKRWHDTPSWIFQLPEFYDWLERKKPVLWCSGKIGSGKTVTAASVIQHILLMKGSEVGPISFFFSQPNIPESLTSSGILKSILQQRLNSMNMSDDVESALRNLEISSDIDDIINLLSTSTIQGPSYILIDGIDEIPKSQRRELFSALSFLISSDNNLCLFLCGQTSLQDEIGCHFKQLLQISLNCESTNDDITKYIEGVIDDKLEAGDLRVQDPNLVNEIKMFIWAFFQVEEITTQPCDQDIRAALHNLPRDLNDLFSRALYRINNGTHSREAQTLFLYITAGKRLMTLDELREAIAITPTQRYSEPARHCNDMDKLASWCENLVEAEEESRVVQFVHHSVRTFLLGDYTDTRLMAFHPGLDEANLRLGEICLTYLDFNDFKTALITQPKPLSIRNPVGIVKSTAKPGSKLATIYDAFLKPGHEVFDLRRSAGLDGSAAATLKISQALKREHPFLEALGLSHKVSFLRARDSRAWLILRHVVSAKLNFTILPWINDAQCQDDALEWAKKNRHHAILRLLWSNDVNTLFKWAADNDDPVLFDALADEVQFSNFESPREILISAASLGRIRAIDELEGPRRVFEDEDMHAALTAAALNGHDDMVEKLINLRFAVDPSNPLPNHSLSPLVAAASRDRLNIVDKLKGGGAGVNLEASCKGGHLDVIERLLSYGAIPNSATLVGAATSGTISIVDMLVRAGVNINDGCYDFETGSHTSTPLYIAARNGNLDFVEKLITAGAHVNTLSLGSNVMQAALLSGKQDVVERLLAAGADISIDNVMMDCDAHLKRILLEFEVDLSKTAGPRRTLVHLAVQMNRLDCIDKLITAGVNTNAADASGRTALHYAALYGNPRCIQSLCQLGSARNTQDHDGNTALHFAVKLGDVGTVDTLVGMSIIDKSVKNKMGETALCIAQSRFSGKKLEALSESLA
ncbi:hypothetical protein PG997_010751 [Apiospora hydei]|uniref:NACHT domain-containing protein n=1 Tax=Apiospora hydei TaxID=1337664 RepID=A0ABR1VL01_9PEZI